MRAPLEPQATVTDARVKIQDQRLTLQAQLCLELPMPRQDADLPGCLEAAIERGGSAAAVAALVHADGPSAPVALVPRLVREQRSSSTRSDTTLQLIHRPTFSPAMRPP